MSISRGSGRPDTSCAISTKSSVVWPRAESTATTFWPLSRAATIRAAARLMSSAPATEVPPNFMTTVSEGMACLRIGDGPLLAAERTPARERAAERDLVGVLEVRPDRKTTRQPGDLDPAAQHVGDVMGRRLARGRGVGRDHDLAHLALLDTSPQLGDLQVLRVDAVDRRQRPAEHVVEAAELVRPLDGDDVGGLLDDADHRPVAAVVLADRAARAFGEVEADLAEADLLLHLADRVGERQRVVVGGTEHVEGEALRGALP